MRLSFIVTFHNGERFFRNCIDSLLDQNIPSNEYEIIVVDDCSNSMEGINLLEEYNNRYSNVIIIHNEKNLRPGASRNVEVKAASGDYIWFIDQDDYVERNCIFNLLKVCGENDLDILTFDYTEITSTGGKEKRSIQTDFCNGIEFFDKVVDGQIFGRDRYCVYLWHSLYSRMYLLNNAILNPEIYAHEDMIFSFHALIKAKKMMTLD